MTGAIGLDILKHQWGLHLSLRIVLLSLQVLLQAAEPDEPQDAVVARQYKENRSAYDITARYWASVYAGAPGTYPDCDKKVRQLKDMGIMEEDARTALSTYSWDVARSLESLFE